MSTHLFAFGPLTTTHLDLIVDAGFKWIELWGMRPHADWQDPKQVEKFSSYMKQIGLDVATFHLPFYNNFGSPDFCWFGFDDPDPKTRKMALDVSKRMVDILPAFDCDTVILHGNGELDKNAERSAENYHRCLEVFLPYCEQRKVRIAVENIMTDRSSTPVLRKMVDEYDSDYLWLCLDTGHAHITESVPEAIQNCGERLLTTHIADNKGMTDDHMVPFAGEINWEEAVLALEKFCPNLENFNFELMYPITGDQQDMEDYRRILDEASRALIRIQKGKTNGE